MSLQTDLTASHLPTPLDVTPADLPVLPQVLLALLRAPHRATSATRRLASLDLAIVARRLGSRALEHTTDTLRDAAFVTLTNASQPETLAALGQIWNDAVREGLVAGHLATAMGIRDPRVAERGAIIGQLGRYISACVSPNIYLTLMKTGADSRTWSEHEARLLDLQPHDLGLALLKSVHADALDCEIARIDLSQTDQLIDAHPVVRCVAAARHMCSSPENRELAAQLSGIAAEQLAKHRDAAEHDHADIRREIEPTNTGRVRNDLSIVAMNLRATARFGQATLGKLESADHFDALANTAADLLGVKTLGIWQLTTDRAAQRFTPQESRKLMPVGGFSASSPIADWALTTHREGSIGAELLSDSGGVGIRHSSANNTALDAQLCRLLGHDAVAFTAIFAADGSPLGMLLAAGSIGDIERLQHSGDFLLDIADSIGAMWPACNLTGANNINEETDHVRLRELVHDIRSPITSVRNYLHVLRDDLPVDARQSHIDAATSELARLTGLVEQITNPADAAQSGCNPTTVIKAVSDNAVIALGADPAGQPDIRLRLADRLPDVAISAANLSQALGNLVQNAIEASEDGAAATIDIRAASYREADREWVEIDVEDNGPGIDPSIESSILQSGASTKQGQHSGLGLGIVARLVEHCDGRLSWSSGAGTTRFRITLPCSGYINDDA